MLAQSQQVLSGPLNVRVHRDGPSTTVTLQGELDLASAEPVQRQLEAAMTDPACQRLVLDMAKLEFIDSCGIAVLLRAVQQDAGFDRLRVVPSAALGVTRVLELTGLEKRLQGLDGAAA